MAETKRRGRPPVDESERLSNFVVRLTPGQRAYVEWRALEDESTASDVVRRLIEVAIDAERPLRVTDAQMAAGALVPGGLRAGERYPVRRLLGLLSFADWDHPIAEEEPGRAI